MTNLRSAFGGAAALRRGPSRRRDSHAEAAHALVQLGREELVGLATRARGPLETPGAGVTGLQDVARN